MGQFLGRKFHVLGISLWGRFQWNGLCMTRRGTWEMKISEIERQTDAETKGEAVIHNTSRKLQGVPRQYRAEGKFSKKLFKVKQSQRRLWTKESQWRTWIPFTMKYYNLKDNNGDLLRWVLSKCLKSLEFADNGINVVVWYYRRRWLTRKSPHNVFEIVVVNSFL